MENRIIRIALLGVGTVGTGVYKLLHMRSEDMMQIAGANIEIAKILVHNIHKERAGIDRSLLTDNFQEIIDDPTIDIVVEVMGGIEPAKSMILQALHAGKHVVSANKDLIAVHGRELFDAAEENGCDFLFEAAVAGAIPIIRPLKQCLAANEITEVMGIMNGTTNFILTKMFEENMSFDDALAIATELGYAEADPTADVEGLDAGRKAAILASLAFHSRVVFDDVYTEGITKITKEDISYAKEFGSVIKLVGRARNTPEGIEVGVYPLLLPEDHPLAQIRNSFNAIYVYGDAVDEAMFMGRGAGEMPTASAVCGDIIDVTRNIMHGCCGRISCTCYRQLPVKENKDVKHKFFIRMQVKNQPGVLAQVATVFGLHKVSITKVVQKMTGGEYTELVIATEAVKEYRMRDALALMKAIDQVQEISSVIREF